MKFGLLSKYFPQEKFLNPPHIGISFSDSNIKAVFFDKTLSKPALKSITVPLENGSIVSGSIMNVGDVAKKLSAIKENFNLPFVFFTIPDELTYTFSISLPITSGLNAAESVAFSIEENVPLALADTVFDFAPSEMIKGGSGQSAVFAVAACAKKEVEKFIKAIYESGMESLGCAPESQAVANSLVPKGSLDKLCVVHARENRIGIYLIKNGMVYFSTLRSVSGGDYGKNLSDEYGKFLEYCLRYDVNKEEAIESVLVCGEFEYAKKAIETLFDIEKRVKDIKLSNVWTNVLKIEKETPSISFEDSINLSGPIGAVLSETT